MAIGGAPDTTSLLEDYKLKVAFATDQIGRLQTQFQVLLTLESAIATALIVANNGSLSKGAKWIALLETALSVAWLMLGWVGRARAVANRNDLEDAGRAWATAAGFGPTYRPVGARQKLLRVAIAAPAVFVVAWAALVVGLAFFD